MVELKFAELQTPLFLEGVNHGVKLDPSKRPIKLHVGYIPQYQTTMLIVSFKGAKSIIPLANVGNTVPLDAAPFDALIEGAIPNHAQYGGANYSVPQNQSNQVPVITTTTANGVSGNVTTTKKPGRPSAQVSTPTSHVFAGEPK